MKKKLLSVQMLSEFSKLTEIQLSKIVGGYGNSSCSGSGSKDCGQSSLRVCCTCPDKEVPRS